MIEMSGPRSRALQRVCIRCGDTNVVSLSCCDGCGFDLTSDLQRDYDLYRGSVPVDAPTGVGERANARSRTPTEPGPTGSNWRPYRDSGREEPAKATMDLGAAVLAAVFEGGPGATKATLDIAALGPFLLDGLEMPDPVAWSPSSAMHVEDPVIVGATTELPEAEPTSPPPEDTGTTPPTAHVVGVVHDWVGMSSFDQAPHDAVSRPVFASTADVSRPVTAKRAAPALPPTRPDLPQQTLLSTPISQRNHIKAGATTYVDAVQGGFQRAPLGWWRHDVVIPVLVAAGAVGLLVFALM